MSMAVSCFPWYAETTLRLLNLPSQPKQIPISASASRFQSYPYPQRLLPPREGSVRSSDQVFYTDLSIYLAPPLPAQLIPLWNGCSVQSARLPAVQTLL